MTAFFPPELKEGSLAAVYAPRVHLPLWDTAFAGALRRAGGERTLVIQDIYSMQWGMVSGAPSMPVMAAMQEERQGDRRVTDAARAYAIAIDGAEVLAATVTNDGTTQRGPSKNDVYVIHSVFSTSGAHGAARPSRFNSLGALPLPILQKCTDDAIGAFSGILGPRFMGRLRAEHRFFCANEFANVVRGDAFARPSASVRALLRDHLGVDRTDDPEAIHAKREGGAGPKWPQRGELPGWGNADLARLRTAVGV
ncbi:hypothetical protein T484DRAFT_2743762 [Baffinella frigidus]|nr:hypothetical protein T484DRAFT_2743762 [Cryptophyta sp. CCMP2293]